MRISTNHTDLIELLQYRMMEDPDQAIFTFLADSTLIDTAVTDSTMTNSTVTGSTASVYGSRQDQVLTRWLLDRQARAIGTLLQRAGAIGKRVLLLYPPGLDFIPAFFGCLYAGAIAVPAYPPRFNRPMPRLRSIVADSQASVILTTAQVHSRLAKRFADIPDLAALTWVESDTLPRIESLVSAWRQPMICRDSLAFLQYTSGSTAEPKGVMVSHGNLLANLFFASKQFGMTSKEKGVFWLPLYHDLGLIGSILGFLYNSSQTILMSPLSFLQQPFRWLQVISQTQATVCGGPNFAYDLCVNRISAAERETLDLSSLTLAFSGAEPIRAETLHRFAETFAPCGFKPEALYTCYGLAEATLCVSGSTRGKRPITQAVEGAAIERNQVRLTTPDADDSRLLVSSGRNLPGQMTVIADPHTLRTCAKDQVGEIWVAGPSVAAGYWNRPEQSQEVFGAYLADTGVGPFLRTGDLGFFHNGELFVTGRIKDLIIIRGRNHYPQDIEHTVEQSYLGLEPGGGAAFSVEVGTQERLVVVQEVNRQHRKLDIETAAQSVRQAVAEAHDLQIYAVVFIKQGSLPRTSSGKVQRFACRTHFLSDELATLGTSRLTEAKIEIDTAQPSDGEMRQALSQLDAEVRHSRLIAHLRNEIAQAIDLDPAQIAPDQPLTALGFDSLILFELKSRLEADLGLLFPTYGFQTEGSIHWLAEQTLAAWAADGSDDASAEPSANKVQQTLHMEQGILQGPVPLTQIQRYFFEKVVVAPGHWNAIGILEVNRRLDGALLAQAVERLLIHHDALRLRFVQQADGTWHQFYAVPSGTPPVMVVDLSDLPHNAQEVAIAQKIDALQTATDLTNGPLMQVALFDLGPETPNQLVMMVHHVIADGLSVRTLLKQFQSLYTELYEQTGQPVHLPPKTTAFRYWAERLHAHAQTDGVQDQLAAWLSRLPGSMPALPRDMSMGDNLEGSAQSVQRFLSEEIGEAFLKKASQGGPNGAESLLLTAIAQACQQWSGESQCLIELDRHGRESLFEDVDLSRTIGFFNNRFPVLVDLKGDDVEANWQGVNQTLDQLPNRGLTYGMLRYLSENDETREGLRTLPQPEIKLIYHSKLVNQLMMLLYEDLGSEGMQVIDFATRAAPNEPRPHTFETYCYFLGPQLYFEWRYSQALYRAETIEALMTHFVQALCTLVGEFE